jgi:hypothetical protein
MLADSNDDDDDERTASMMMHVHSVNQINHVAAIYYRCFLVSAHPVSNILCFFRANVT